MWGSGADEEGGLGLGQSGNSRGEDRNGTARGGEGCRVRRGGRKVTFVSQAPHRPGG